MHVNGAVVAILLEWVGVVGSPVLQRAEQQ